MALQFEEIPDTDNDYKKTNYNTEMTLDLIVSLLNETKQEIRHLDQQWHMEYLNLNNKVDKSYYSLGTKIENISNKIDSSNAIMNNRIDASNTSVGRKIDRLTYTIIGLLLAGIGVLANKLPF